MSKTKPKCDHLIARSLDIAEYLELSTYEQVVKILFKHNQSEKKYLSMSMINPKMYFDGRRNLTYMFKYCPKCGVELNWNEIKEKL